MRFSRMMVVALAGLLAAGASAQEPTKDDIAKAEKQAEAVADLVAAADLTAFGRDLKSPSRW